MIGQLVANVQAWKCAHVRVVGFQSVGDDFAAIAFDAQARQPFPITSSELIGRVGGERLLRAFQARRERRRRRAANRCQLVIDGLFEVIERCAERQELL